jgi:hypothetical protein
VTPRAMGFLRRNRQEVLLLALILAIAAPLRLLALDRFPPGLYYDEAANAVDALDTLRSGVWPALLRYAGRCGVISGFFP